MTTQKPPFFLKTYELRILKKVLLNTFFVPTLTLFFSACQPILLPSSVHETQSTSPVTIKEQAKNYTPNVSQSSTESYPSLTPSATASTLPPPPSEGTVAQYSEWLFDGPEGHNFAYYLAQGYRRFSKQEDNSHDFAQAAIFLQRAGAVERGERIEPENLSTRILPAWAVDDLVYARQRLIRALGRGAGMRLPKIAANAQVAFDCWMEQQEENIQPQDVASCRKAFESFIVRLEEHQPKAVSSPAKICSVRQEPVTCSERRNFTLNFEFNRHDITPNSENVIREIAELMKINVAEFIQVKAYTDLSGSNQYNDRLSQNRLTSTLAALERAGVPSDRIALVRHYGETQPLVKTADGVREAANRRVEISFVCPSANKISNRSDNLETKRNSQVE